MVETETKRLSRYYFYTPYCIILKITLKIIKLDSDIIPLQDHFPFPQVAFAFK